MEKFTMLFLLSVSFCVVGSDIPDGWIVENLIPNTISLIPEQAPAYIEISDPISGMRKTNRDKNKFIVKCKKYRNVLLNKENSNKYCDRYYYFDPGAVANILKRKLAKKTLEILDWAKECYDTNNFSLILKYYKNGENGQKVKYKKVIYSDQIPLMNYFVPGGCKYENFEVVFMPNGNSWMCEQQIQGLKNDSYFYKFPQLSERQVQETKKLNKYRINLVDIQKNILRYFYGYCRKSLETDLISYHQTGYVLDYYWVIRILDRVTGKDIICKVIEKDQDCNAEFLIVETEHNLCPKTMVNIVYSITPSNVQYHEN